MKHRLSITLDEETVFLIMDKLRENRRFYKNKSNLVEYAVKKAFNENGPN